MRGIASAAAAVRRVLPKALVSVFAIVTAAACLAGCSSTPNYPFIVEGYMEMQPEKQSSVNLGEYIPTDVKVVYHDCTDFDGQAFYWLYQYTKASNGINCVEYESLDNIKMAFNISYSASDDALIQTYYSNPYAGTVSQVKVEAPQIGSTGATSQDGYAIETSPYLFTVHTKAADFADCICVIEKDGKEPIMAFFYAKGHGIVLGVVKSEKRGWFVNSEAARITYYETASTYTGPDDGEAEPYDPATTSSDPEVLALENHFGGGGTYESPATGKTIEVVPVEENGKWKIQLHFDDGVVATFGITGVGYPRIDDKKMIEFYYEDETNGSGETVRYLPADPSGFQIISEHNTGNGMVGHEGAYEKKD